MENDNVSGCGPCATRRNVLAAAGALGVTAALSGCAVYGGDSKSGGGDPAAAPGGASAGGGGSTGASAGTSAGAGGANGGGGAPLARTSDIPVGGGKVFESQGVVVTQPQAGTFKAFSATCTHQGCTVNEVRNGTINCPCHGSRFKVADGSVAGGPAPKALAAKAITVDGDSIRLK
jgi:nitrite reductase/ring-hydroxylating ferredoxin subunit